MHLFCSKLIMYRANDLYEKANKKRIKYFLKKAKNVAEIKFLLNIHWKLHIWKKNAKYSVRHCVSEISLCNWRGRAWLIESLKKRISAAETRAEQKLFSVKYQIFAEAPSFLLLLYIYKNRRNFCICGEISGGISQVPTRRILTFTQNEKSPPQLAVIFHARNIRERAVRAYLTYAYAYSYIPRLV